MIQRQLTRISLTLFDMSMLFTVRNACGSDVEASIFDRVQVQIGFENNPLMIRRVIYREFYT